MRALTLCLPGLLAVALCSAPVALADEIKNTNCKKYDLEGFGFIDDHTAVLEYTTRTYAPPNNRRRFKVTFSNACPRLKDANFVAINNRAFCPRKGDVLTFSKRPIGQEENPDSCRIDTAEEIPVPGASPPPSN
jgi:hypothetical protein